MDDKVFRWRNNHPKCIFCKYYSARRVGIEEVTVQQCIAKDKFLNNFTERIPRYFCETYEVKEQ